MRFSGNGVASVMPFLRYAGYSARIWGVSSQGHRKYKSTDLLTYTASGRRPLIISYVNNYLYSEFCTTICPFFTICFRFIPFLVLSKEQAKQMSTHLLFCFWENPNPLLPSIPTPPSNGFLPNIKAELLKRFSVNLSNKSIALVESAKKKSRMFSKPAAFQYAIH